jgi:hypothetical protein
VIGFNTEYISAFNIQLESVYVDHTATNRPYRPVENMIEYAKTLAANPHTEFSHYGSTSFSKLRILNRNDALFSKEPPQVIQCRSRPLCGPSDWQRVDWSNLEGHQNAQNCLKT